MPDFLRTESGSAGLLLAATVVALVWANSPLAGAYDDLWAAHLDLGVADLDLRHWVNDGLMAFFFFLVGLEVKRELVVGELRDRRAAAVPIVAALAGMAVPAVIYAAINAGGPGAGGWGIVMATDIAFVLGVVALLGDRCPPGVRIFLLTLAVVDDIGAVAVIAVFYSSGVEVAALAGAVATTAPAVRGRALAGVERRGLAGRRAGAVVADAGVRRAPGHRRGGRGAGVPGCGGTAVRARGAPVLEHGHRAPVRAGQRRRAAGRGGPVGRAAGSAITLGVLAGLVVGKAAGVGLSSLLTVRTRHGACPEGMRAGHVGAAGTLAGIGFTVSLFVARASWPSTDPALRAEAKIGVLAASLVAAVVGWALFRALDRRGPPEAGRKPAKRRNLDSDADRVLASVAAPVVATDPRSDVPPLLRSCRAAVPALRRRSRRHARVGGQAGR